MVMKDNGGGEMTNLVISRAGNKKCITERVKKNWVTGNNGKYAWRITKENTKNKSVPHSI